ncbi:D-alanyl-D-alanine carboxypeptidase [Streptomyces sp. P38-E01]|uniref:D-alanyl-D-alanine carboxypeptidase n=1 Tax=Streptomyces tardus TaxID=2780544 RepID=A0A949JDY4_9ACTN|nr:D-alanyl-D-alanine carboxypeptidase [Streptomyces tardus]MBU7596775.1 D-alanyl-D-alanine carboxypeptidase [Streptomyces tardus]
MAGESPDRSKQQQSSGETTRQGDAVPPEPSAPPRPAKSPSDPRTLLGRESDRNTDEERGSTDSDAAKGAEADSGPDAEPAVEPDSDAADAGESTSAAHPADSPVDQPTTAFTFRARDAERAKGSEGSNKPKGAGNAKGAKDSTETKSAKSTKSTKSAAGSKSSKPAGSAKKDAADGSSDAEGAESPAAPKGSKRSTSSSSGKKPKETASSGAGSGSGAGAGSGSGTGAKAEKPRGADDDTAGTGGTARKHDERTTMLRIPTSAASAAASKSEDADADGTDAPVAEPEETESAGAAEAFNALSPEPENESGSGSASEAPPEAEADTEAEADAEAGSSESSGVEPERAPNSEPEVEVDTPSGVKPSAGAAAEPKPAAKSEPEPGSKAEPGPKSEAGAEPEADSATDSEKDSDSDDSGTEKPAEADDAEKSATAAAAAKSPAPSAKSEPAESDAADTDAAADSSTDPDTDAARPADAKPGAEPGAKPGAEPDSEPDAKLASEPGTAGSADEPERASRFVPLRSLDEPPRPPAPPAQPPAPPAGAPLPSAEPPEAERTRQQPLPPVPGQRPLDLLAQLTNKPAPPETPIRTLVRRVKIWTPLLGLLVLVVIGAQLLRPLPDPELKLTTQATHTFDGEKPTIAWPDRGQAALEVEGLGSLGTSGDQKPVPIASVAKTMTAYLLLRDHPMKAGADGKKIPVDKQAEDDAGLSAQGESTVDVKEGETLTQREALNAVMIASANNVARLVARWDSGTEKAFVEKMNKTADELGMKNTTYTDPSGLRKETVSTARDQVKLGRAAMKHEAFRESVRLPSYKDRNGKQQNNWNRLVPEFGTVGIKTGTTTAAGGNLLFAAEKEIGGTRQLIIGAVLSQHQPPIIDSVLAAGKDLILSAQDALESEVVLKKGAVVGAVDDGLGGRTPLVAAEEVAAVGWPGLKVELGLAEGKKGLPREAEAGTAVGRVTVGSGPGQVKVPVTLREELTEPGTGARLTRIF